MKLVALSRTCMACPSQWDGQLDNDRPVYFRHRSGKFRAYLGPVGGDAWSAVLAERPILECSYGDEWSGDMTDEQLVELLIENGWEVELENGRKADNYEEWLFENEQ